MTFAAGQIVDEDDMAAIEAASTQKNIGRLVASGTQALADNTTVAITFSTEEFDTGGFHSTVTNNSRVTPTVAGYYRFHGAVWFEAQTTPVTSAAFFRMNGSAVLAPADRDTPGAAAQSRATTVLQPFNGSTDYIELCAVQDSAGADNTNQSNQFSSVMEWEYVREL